ncbi:hypothetical protein PR202_ga27504 [Eleusine coracana subsp. coracana]|uniref:Uncharacterized protein n=1 Tax=Eleusine coracana subsp. coracana TaxID=191504 RepID=A0AAV5DH07_ELECO|nr:hypothetical protein PR202_ga27504 [Eleusine coracana subsp. coracana]
MLALRTLMTTVLHILPLRNLDNNHNESDGSSNYYDSDWSGPSDDEGDDRMVCYSLIADEHKKKPYKFLIDGNNRSADSGSPRDDCGGNSNFGGNGMLCSLSNVKTMELLAHPGEVQFNLLADTTALSFVYAFFTVDDYAINSYGDV